MNKLNQLDKLTLIELIAKKDKLIEALIDECDAVWSTQQGNVDYAKARAKRLEIERAYSDGKMPPLVGYTR